MRKSLDINVQMNSYTMLSAGYHLNRDNVVQVRPPARPYIKKSFRGILMYELAVDYINKYCNYADSNLKHHGLQIVTA